MASSRATLLALLMAATAAADTPEPGSAEAIARFTTDPRFLNPWIASVPDSAAVPSPSDFLGHVAGAPGELTRSARIHAYYRALAASSPRVRVETIGRTEEGRDILLAVIADEAGIGDLPRLKAATAALADPRRTDPAQAEALIAGARPFYYFNGALHADETGSAEMLMELAYRLAVSDDPRIRRIRENVVVLINPVADPDGRDKMADWFYRYLKGRTDYARPAAPVAAVLEPLRVRGHQPRRAPARVRGDARRAPDVLRLPPAGDPRPARRHPAAADLERHRALQPEPRPHRPLRVPEDEPARGHDAHRPRHAGGVDVGLRRRVRPSLPGLDRDEPQRDRPRLRDLRQRHRGDRGPRGRGGRHEPRVVPARARRSPLPLVDARQRQLPADARRWPSSTTSRASRRNTCAASIARAGTPGGRASRASRSRSSFPPTRATGGGWPSSSTCCARSGSRSGTTRAALEVAEGPLRRRQLRRPPRPAVPELRGRPARPRRQFPSDAPHLPYDDVSWSLPLHFGVQVVRVDDARVREAAVDPVTADVTIEARVAGAGPVFLLADRGQEALLAARHRLSAFRVEIAEEAFTAGGEAYAAGSWILPAQDGARRRRARRRRGARPRLRERGHGARRPPPRRAAGPDRPLRPLGRHRLHRLDPLRPRREARPLRLPAGRRPARGQPPAEGGRHRLRPRAAGPGRADPRHRARRGTDALRADAGVSRASASRWRRATSPAAPASPASGTSRRSCARAASW